LQRSDTKYSGGTSRSRYVGAPPSPPAAKLPQTADTADVGTLPQFDRVAALPEPEVPGFLKWASHVDKKWWPWDLVAATSGSEDVNVSVAGE